MDYCKLLSTKQNNKERMCECMNKEASEKRDIFLQELTKMSREDINKYIREKGKGPKLARAFSYVKDDKQI